MTNQFSPHWDNKKLTVIEFIAGPGIGKSCSAADTFSLLSKQGKKVELVHEIAKDLTWSQNYPMLTEQDWILSHQNHLLRRLVGKVDYVVSDTSMLLGLFYKPDGFTQFFDKFLIETHGSYNNITILLKRNPAFEYKHHGRNQTVDEALSIDQKVEQYLLDCNIPYYSMMAGDDVPQQVVNIIRMRDVFI